jgi:choice-of-anchor B domain-containing protein
MIIFSNRLSLIFIFTMLYLPFHAQESLNMSLLGQYDHNDGRASGSWIYVAPDGHEYALLGAQTGTVIIDMDNMPLDEVAFISGPVSNWREITVVGQHAYVTTEGSSADHPGMQVISLENLPEEAPLVATFNSTFSRGHILQKDIFQEAPYVYVIGTTATSGIHIIDVSDPANPVQVGLYAPGYYIHDCHVRGDLLFAAAFFNGVTEVLDISDRTNPVVIAEIPDPGGSTHSYSTTEDGNYLIVADEADGLPGRIYDISDLQNPEELAQYTASEASLVHNPYVRGDFCFISHNTEGIRVLDITDPATPVEVGFYDTYEGPSGGFNGLWSACPYSSSGRIIGGNRENGLYMWEFNNTYAGRFYGTVIDSLQGSPIFNARIEVLENSQSYFSDPQGAFRGGSVAGDYTLVVEASGYSTKTIPITLEEGNNIDLTIELSQSLNDLQKTTPELVIDISPNPAIGETRISWPEGTRIQTLEIINSEGKVVQQKRVMGQYALNLKTDGWQKGLYYVILTDSNDQPAGRKALVVQ